MASDQRERRLFILFTDWFSHKEQRGDYGVPPEKIEAYRRRISKLARENQVQAIAEEMNWDSMARSAASKALHLRKPIPLMEDAIRYINQILIGQEIPSETELIARELGLPYKACDLTMDEQLKNGPLEPPDSTNEGRTQWEDQTFPPREQAWITSLLELRHWPVLFVCGNRHKRTFLPRLAEADLNVVVVPEEFEPCPTDSGDLTT